MFPGWLSYNYHQLIISDTGLLGLTYNCDLLAYLGYHSKMILLLSMDNVAP
jgi:hypothetical protein